MKDILNLGCGMNKFASALNVDSNPRVNPDMVLDLDLLPWPFSNCRFNLVYALDIFEHVTNPIEFMSEIHRVLNPKGLLNIRTTSWKTRQSFRDPTHKRFCTLHTFDYWDPSTLLGQQYGYYTEQKFKIISQHPDGQELVFELRKI